MGEIKDWIKGWLEYTNNIESPSIYSEWVAVSLIAAALSRRVCLMWDRKLFPNFYIFLVGPPGVKKGTALNPAREFLDYIGVYTAPESLTRRKFLSNLAKSSLLSGAPSLNNIMTAISNVTIFSSEITVLINSGNLQMVKDLTDLYDFDKDVWTYETEGSGSDVISNPFVNIIGATQPGMLTSMIPDEAVTMGFMSRVISVFEDKRGKVVVFPQDLKPEEELKKKLKEKLMEYSTWSGWFTINDSFREVYAPWYRNQEKDINLQEEKLIYYIQRRPTHLLKLCMIMNASRSGNMVLDAQDFKRALDLLHHTEKKMSRTFAGMGKADNAEAVDMVGSYLFNVKEIRYSKLLRRFHRDVEDDRLAKIIATFEKMGEVIIQSIPGEPKDFLIKIKEEFIGDINLVN